MSYQSRKLKSPTIRYANGKPQRASEKKAHRSDAERWKEITEAATSPDASEQAKIRLRDAKVSHIPLIDWAQVIRMRDALASGPLIYRKADDMLYRIGLLEDYDSGANHSGGVGPTKLAYDTFYIKNGGINPYYYHFEGDE